jgi:hypothetical protein
MLEKLLNSLFALTELKLDKTGLALKKLEVDIYSGD